MGWILPQVYFAAPRMTSQRSPGRAAHPCSIQPNRFNLNPIFQYHICWFATGDCKPPQTPRTPAQGMPILTPTPQPSDSTGASEGLPGQTPAGGQQGHPAEKQRDAVAFRPVISSSPTAARAQAEPKRGVFASRSVPPPAITSKPVPASCRMKLPLQVGKRLIKKNVLSRESFTKRRPRRRGGNNGVFRRFRQAEGTGELLG